MRRGIIFLFITLPVFAGSVFSQPPIKIQWREGKAVAVKVPKKSLVSQTASDDWNLVVRLQSSGSDVLGKMKITADTLSFSPLWPFTAGLHYDVLWRSEKIGSFKIPDQLLAKEPLKVTIYPTTKTVPANLLKIYLKFSEPMTVGRAYSYLSLINVKGDTLHETFLEMEPELWSNDQTQLTVWLDPGRIKRDLVLNKVLGNPLTVGENYTLSVSQDWKSVTGNSSGNPLVKKFSVSDFDRKHPATNAWKVHLGKKNQIVIDFGEPMDFAIALEGISIWHGTARVNGIMAVMNEEKQWVFTSSADLTKGDYTIKVESKVEDLAGNNLNRLFDTDIQSKEEQPDAISAPVHEIPFRVE